MKVLIRKIKRTNKFALFLYILLLLIFIGGYFFFTKALLSLVGIETIIRTSLLIFFGVWFIIYLLFGLSTMLTKKYKKFSVLTFFQIIFIVIMVFAFLIIHKIYSKIDLISEQEYTTYTTNLISLKNTELKQNSKIGMISNNQDIEGYILANTLLKRENLKQKVEYYDDYFTMLSALYNNEIDAVFVSSNYAIIFGSEAVFENIFQETKVLYKYSEEMKTKTITNSNKKLTEPFTVLLMGVDSEYDGLNANAAFNGDTLMLITFNPATLTATMFSIPRDTYVPIACNNNRYHKINSAAAYGTECVINTIQNLVDIEIDYYAKINFNGVIDLVNALGGLDIEVEQPDYKNYVAKYGPGRLCESNSWRDMANLVCMDTGMQHLSGEQTLAYARNRHGFLASDLARNRHQQQIVEAIAKKVMHVNSFSDFEKLLDVVGKNIATNLSTTQILSFYQTLKNMLLQGLSGNDFINIQKTYLEVYNLPVMIGGMQLSALGYYDKSLETIHDALEVNLGLKKEEMIKTFSYDYNEEYTSPVIGKGITGGGKGATVPNFIGKTVSEAEIWAKNNDITLSKGFVCSNGVPGIIGNQSVSIGTPVKSISYMEIYINQTCDNDNIQKPDNTKDPDDDNNTSNNGGQKPDDDENKPIPPIPGGPDEGDKDPEGPTGGNEPDEPNPIVPGTPGDNGSDEE